MSTWSPLCEWMEVLDPIEEPPPAEVAYPEDDHPEYEEDGEEI